MGTTISSEMLVEDLVHTYPSAVRVLQDLGIACVLCGEPVWGTLADLVTARGKDLTTVLNALRRLESS